MKMNILSKKDANYIIKNIGNLNLPYFDKKKVELFDNSLGITFCLPRNSLFKLVEYCKLNNLCISFNNGRINISVVKVSNFEDSWW